MPHRHAVVTPHRTNVTPSDLEPPLPPAKALVAERAQTGGRELRRDDPGISDDAPAEAQQPHRRVDVFGQRAWVEADGLECGCSPVSVTAAEETEAECACTTWMPDGVHL